MMIVKFVTHEKRRIGSFLKPRRIFYYEGDGSTDLIPLA